MLTLSVVIPTYNCQQYVAEAIHSALTQAADEVIVVDDGSTDDTKGAIASFNSPQLRYVWQPNQGVSAARNHGIELAQCDLVAFLDADDSFLPDTLAQQIQQFASDPNLGLVQSGWRRVSESGDFIADVSPWTLAGDLTIESFLKFKSVLPSALVVRRDWLLSVQGFDRELQAAEDVDLVSRLLLAGCPATWLKTIGVNYRQRSDSAMGNSLVQARDLNNFLDKLFGRTDLPESVRLLERSVRYHTLVWAAWYLYYTGHPAEMINQLKRAWQYTPYLPAEALILWMDSFDTFSKAEKTPLNVAELIGLAGWQQMVVWLLQQR